MPTVALRCLKPGHILCAMASLGTKIRRARERARMSQQELAVAVGKSVRAVNDWENDRTSPRNSIGAIEAVLHVRLDDDEDGGEADALPQLVADNQHDPRVMEIWAMRYLARSTKLAHIAYLLEREGPVARQPGTVTNGRPLAL